MKSNRRKGEHKRVMGLMAETERPIKTLGRVTTDDIWIWPRY